MNPKQNELFRWGKTTDESIEMSSET